MTQRFEVGDRVRIDIPDELDPEHDSYHGKQGNVIRVKQDDAEQITGDQRESYIYSVELESGDVVDFRWRDLRPR